jgi:hypothetical protein
MMPVNMQFVTENTLTKPPVQQGGGIGGNESTAPGEENKSVRHYFVTSFPAFRDAFGRILARKKANEDDFQRTFAPVFVGIASALSFDPNSEPGAIALSS